MNLNFLAHQNSILVTPVDKFESVFPLFGFVKKKSMVSIGTKNWESQKQLKIKHLNQTDSLQIPINSIQTLYRELWAYKDIKRPIHVVNYLHDLR